MSIEAVRGLVAHGFGVTALSDMVFRPWSLEGKRIEARPILDLVPPMEVGALWHPDVRMNTHAEALQQFLLHAYGQ
jgi:DNA-binding transcriptional LysR family regulator